MNGTFSFRFLSLSFLFVFVCLVLFPAGNRTRAAARAADGSQDAALQDEGEDPLPDPLPGDEPLHEEEPLLEPAIPESGLVGFSETALDAMSSRGAYCTTPVRIMPLGDSITHGDGDCSDPKPGGNEEFCSGYRNELWNYLKTTYSVNFVGSKSTGKAGQNFDKDNEGHSGYRADQIAVNIYGLSGENWIISAPGDPAHIILLHIGTNDVGFENTSVETIRTRINNILNKIDKFEKDRNQNVWVILAKIIRREDEYEWKVKDLNEAIESVFDEWLEKGDRISLVDMHTVVSTAEMFDNLHPNNDGYIDMAEVWRDALEDILVCAVDDQHSVPQYSKRVILDVLGNDGGTSLALKSVSPGSKGGKVFLDGGVVKYTPPPNFVGQETFTYTLQSAPNMNPTATVTVTVTRRVQTFFPLAMNLR